jgi:hypothetical protein
MAWGKIKRQDIQEMLGTFVLAEAMHMRAIGRLPGLIDPIWKEFKEKDKCK